MKRTSNSGASGTDERGQTVQDFAVGIGIFILAVAFVFTFVPTIITPFTDAGGAETAQADRIAATIVTNASDGQPNGIDLDEFNSTYGTADSAALNETLGLRSSDGHAFDRVNITIWELDEYGDPNASPITSGGSAYDSQVGGSATRIVTSDDNCDPACRLIVRVW